MSQLEPPPARYTRAEPRLAATNRLLSTIALTLAILLMLAALIAGLFTATALIRAAHALHPAPTATGCPYGDNECGG